ncbi:ABC transporter substrate-binding protein [Paenibacillus sp. NPDC058071]|uniref:ABC transporter substrate-binding protein n=1 Tax=Paenibacillus sp. NPDC058071 TaxID=3346326 RepID=UPI0036DA226F
MKAFKQTMLPLLAVILTLLLAAGCGSNAANNGKGNSNANQGAGQQTENANNGGKPEETSAAGGKTTYPLTVKNYSLSGEGGSWSDKSQTFDKAPEKVVANTQGAAELLIKLGLTDKMVGVAAVYGGGDPDVAKEFKKIPVISKDYASKELVVGAGPDLVLGRGDLFADADWGVGTVDALNALNIKTFVQSTSIKGATLDSLYNDIAQIGQIFDAQDNAAAYIEELKKRAQAIKDGSAAVGGKTFAYSSDAGEGAIAVYSGNTDTFQAEVLGLLGLKNAFGDLTGEISREQLIATNPDILLLSYYSGAPDPEQTIKKFYADPALQSLKAIQNKAIYVIDFNQFWGYSYSIFDGAEKLAKELGAK